MTLSLSTIKNWSLQLGLAAFAALAPIHTVMLVVAILIMMDTAAGIWAAKKEGEQITSAKLRRTVSKAVVYQMAVISGFLVEKWLIDGLLPVSKIVAGAIGTIEFKSLLENCNRITGMDVFKEVIAKLGSKNEAPPPPTDTAPPPSA